MSVETKLVFNFDGLNKLLKNAEDGNKVVKVGVLGNERNATILATHEFGSITKRIPRRSVLKDTLSYKEKDLKSKIAELAANNITTPNGFIITLKKLGFYAESLIQQGFKTSGFGKWQPLKKSTIDAKKSDKILIDTGQLRRGITSKVDNK